MAIVSTVLNDTASDQATLGGGGGVGKVAAAVRGRVCSPEQLTDHAGTRERMVVSLWARLHLRLLPASCFTRTLYIVLEKIEIFLEKCFFFRNLISFYLFVNCEFLKF